MALVHPEARRSFAHPGLDVRQLIDSATDAVARFLSVWEEAIDPVTMPAGVELRFTEPSSRIRDF